MNPLLYLQWKLTKSGILTSVGCDHGGFFKTSAAATSSSSSSPDLQMRFLAARALSPDGMSTYAKVIIDVILKHYCYLLLLLLLHID